MSALAEAEKYLQARLRWLQRQLPLDGSDTQHWQEYREVSLALVAVRAQLYTSRLGPAPVPARQRPRPA